MTDLPFIEIDIDGLPAMARMFRGADAPARAEVASELAGNIGLTCNVAARQLGATQEEQAVALGLVVAGTLNRLAPQLEVEALDAIAADFEVLLKSYRDALAALRRLAAMPPPFADDRPPAASGARRPRRETE